MRAFYNNVFKNYFLLTLTLFVSEIIFRAVLKIPILDWSVLRIFVGINIVSLLCSAIFSLFGRVVSNILSFILALVSTVYGVAQAGFYNYLGVYVSLGTSSQLGAVKDYIGDYIQSFSWTYWLIIIPLLLLLLFYAFCDHRISVLERNDQIDFSDKFNSPERKEQNDKIRNKKKKTARINSKINAVIIAAALCGVYYYLLTAKFMQNEIQLKTTKELFKNPDIPNIAVSVFGYNGFALLDVKGVAMPAPTEEIGEEFNDGYVIKEQVLSDYTRYVDDNLWKEVIANESNRNYKKLSNYFISQDITDKNDFTGIFKDKNLIVIMMESTNNIVLNEEYFPNMHKLYTEGWSWENSYSPRNSCSTGNNEMSGMISLYSINNSCTANNYKRNVYPEALLNLFVNAGYTTSSYHNYTEQYYYRKTYHPNMGSQHFYGVQELGIPYSNVYQEWPSDVELMKKVLEITKNQEKFAAWVTTVSAHQPYTVNSELASKNMDIFKDTKYNTSLKRYLSKLYEFDLSIGTLIEGLKEQGKLDDTVIVLYADHYPYGLTTSTLNSYFDYDVTKQLEVDRTPFIIYNSTITPQIYSEYTSYMNLTPTVANLFNLEYDPRLYAGKDLLSSTYDGRVYFADGSWKDKIAFYSASTGKITYANNTDKYTSEEIKNINTVIKNRIAMSNLAIRTDYFNYLYNAKEELRLKKVQVAEEEAKKKEEEEKAKQDSQAQTNQPVTEPENDGTEVGNN